MLETADIDDPAAARVFASPRQRKLLLALIEQERSLSELARLTETPLNLLHHHVRKFVSLGLATVTRAEPRAGAPIKFYRAAARSFFVPAELMGSDLGARSSTRLRQALERSLAGSLKGALYTHDDKGPQIRLVREAGLHVNATEIWRELHLSDADAALLVEELRSLLRRFKSDSGRARRTYIVHAALAPA